MPSANASRRSQEKPREIMDAAEVGFHPLRALEEQTLGPDRAGGRGERGVGGAGALASGSLAALCLQATGLGSGRPEPSAGPPGPLPERLSQIHSGSHFSLGRLEAWLTRSVSLRWRAGEGGAEGV